MYKGILEVDMPFLGGKLNDLVRTAKSEIESYGINVEDRNDCYFVSIVAPGISKSSIKIDVEESILSVAYPAPERSRGTKWLRRDWEISAFSKKIKLNSDADPKKITASLENGILSIEIQKRVEPQTKREIEVK